MADLHSTGGRAEAAPDGIGALVDDEGRRAYRLERATTVIGRDPASAILIDDPEVSRLHAQVRREGERYVLVSIGPSGTLVNGQLIDGPRALAENDRVDVGQTTFRFTRGITPAGYAIGPDSDVMAFIMSGVPTSSTETIAVRLRPKPSGMHRAAIIAIVVVVLGAIVFFAIRR